MPIIRRTKCPGHPELRAGFAVGSGRRGYPFQFAAGTSEVCRQDRAGGRFLPAPLVRQGSEHGAADSWAQIGIVCFILFIGCLILFFFSKWIHLKKIGFYLGLVFLVLVIFAKYLCQGKPEGRAINRKSAIVFAPTVTVKSSPDASGTDLFILHEGTKVSIKSKLGDWNEIEMEDGNVGWMPSKDMEII